MLTSLLTLGTPFIISGLIQLIKKLPAFDSLSDAARTPAIRLLGALVSLAYVVFTLWVSPASLDANALGASVQLAGLTFFAWLTSLGLFHGFKKA